jgi:hypothetical protein
LPDCADKRLFQIAPARICRFGPIFKKACSVIEKLDPGANFIENALKMPGFDRYDQASLR